MTCPMRTQSMSNPVCTIPAMVCSRVRYALDGQPNAERRPADVEMARVLKTAPMRMASDPSSGAIAHWKHGALHDVVEPMNDHVIMTYPTACSGWSGAPGNQSRSERRVPGS